MLRNIGIFILCSGLAAVVFVSGIMAYYLCDELRAYNSVLQTTQKLQEKIEVNKERQRRIFAQNVEPVARIEIGEKIIQLTEPVSKATEDKIQPIDIGGEMYAGILSIPALSLVLPVNNEWSYERLKNSPCLYWGDILGSAVICAHDYKSHFGNISSLLYGDFVIIIDSKGKEYRYRVELVTILDETDVETMLDSVYDLTLFTCDSRDDSKRVAVRCVRRRAE